MISYPRTTASLTLVSAIIFSVSWLAMHQCHAGILVEGGGTWKVRQVNSRLTPGDATEAQIVLDGFDTIGEASVAVMALDFGGTGLFDVDQEFPGLRNGENAYAIEATGRIDVTKPGVITFGVFADDFARLEIDGTTIVETGTNGAEALASTNLSAGVHEVRVVYYEGTGSADLEVFVAQENGDFATFADASFELLEVVSDQSPTDVSISGATFPSNAVAGGVVGELSATGGAGGEHRFELLFPVDPASPLTLIGLGSAGWRYLDDGSLPAGDWTAPGFDDSAWTADGIAPLGYSDTIVQTTIDNGPDPDTRWIAAYFRNSFAVPVGELERIDAVTLSVLRDDAIAVHINGVEVLRDNLPGGPLENSTLAVHTVGGAEEDAYFDYRVPKGVLLEGVNTIAVETHQAAVTSSDMFFDLSLQYRRRADLGGAEANFEIVDNQLVLAEDAAGIPAPAGTGFDLGVRATNPCGLSFEGTLRVVAGGASASAPTSVTLDNTIVGEGLPPGTLVGLLAAADADAADRHRFEFSATGLFSDNTLFSIYGNELRTAAEFDARVRDSYTINIEAVDPVGQSATRLFNISVSPSPARIRITPESIPENAPEFSVVGDLSTLDPFTENHSYRLLVDVDPVPVPLLDFGSEWRYLDDGSGQGLAWTAPGFDDAGWLSGEAPLGYGELGPAGATITPVTEVGFGADPDNKFAATYFRSSFQVVDPNSVEELRFEMALDDGAIVYINGQELFRVRVDDVISASDYTGQGAGNEAVNDALSITGDLPRILVAGSNTIAVRLHQTTPTSSDLWLDLQLDAILRTGGADSDHFFLVGDQLLTNKEVAEIPAEDGDEFTVQVESTSDLGEVLVEALTFRVGPPSANAPTDIALDNDTIDEGLPAGSLVGNLSATDPDGGAFAYTLEPDPLFPDNAQFVAFGGQLFTQARLDFDDGATRTIRITTTDNTGLRFAETFVIGLRQVLEAPTGITLDPSEFPFDAEVGTAIGVLSTEDNNAADTHIYSFGNWPPVPGTPLLPFGSAWNYLDDGSDQGSAWTGLLFDDSGWESGDGQLGYGDGDEQTVVGFGPDAQNKFATTYFRHVINVPAPAPLGYQIRVLFDDAVVVHINGEEVGRSNNLPAVVAFDTVATATTPDNTISEPLALPAGTIVAGDNVIAVEVHQANATSSDVSFDLELVPFVPSPYPAYFAISADELVTTVDFATTGITPPFTFNVPVVARDPSGQSVEVLLAVDMTGGAADTDIDGLPDAWELANFGDLSFDAGDDPDMDGRDNGDEYSADTDPNAAADFLQISAITLGAGGAEVTWPARPGRIYALYRSATAVAGSWELVEGGLSVPAPGDLSATDAAAPSPGDMFYRVEVQAPPPE